jgi:hypothetical protein
MTDMKKTLRFLRNLLKKSHERCTLKKHYTLPNRLFRKKVIYAHILNKSILSLLHCITKTDLMAPKLPNCYLNKRSEKLEHRQYLTVCPNVRPR